MTKTKLPKGKLSLRWVQARNVIQCYLSGRYLDGCNGGTDEEAIEALISYYEVDEVRLDHLKKHGHGFFIK